MGCLCRCEFIRTFNNIDGAAMSTMKETMQKQNKEEKASTEKINTGRRQAMRKLAYTPPTLISLGQINQASAQGSTLPCPPECPPPPPG